MSRPKTILIFLLIFCSVSVDAVICTAFGYYFGYSRGLDSTNESFAAQVQQYDARIDNLQSRLRSEQQKNEHLSKTISTLSDRNKKLTDVVARLRSTLNDIDLGQAYYHGAYDVCFVYLKSVPDCQWLAEYIHEHKVYELRLKEPLDGWEDVAPEMETKETKVDGEG